MGAISRLAGRLIAGMLLPAALSLGRPALAQNLTSPAMHMADAPSAQDLGCMTAALYYEARGEGVAGEQAVAQVVLNRLASPAFPKSVCAVIYQGAPSAGCQFTFACDGSQSRPLEPNAWRQAATVAAQALTGFIDPIVAGATHYHTLSVHPVWDAAMQPTLTLGRHQFFRSGRGGARPMVVSSFTRPAAGAPHAAAFSVWGLQVALVTPQRGGVDVRSSSSAPVEPPANPAGGS